MVQVTPFLLRKAQQAVLQLLLSSCISSFHSEPLSESPFAATEGQDDLQSAWPGFVPREGHLCPVSRAG